MHISWLDGISSHRNWVTHLQMNGGSNLKHTPQPSSRKQVAISTSGPGWVKFSGIKHQTHVTSFSAHLRSFHVKSLFSALWRLQLNHHPTPTTHPHVGLAKWFEWTSGNGKYEAEFCLGQRKIKSTKRRKHMLSFDREREREGANEPTNIQNNCTHNPQAKLSKMSSQQIYLLASDWPNFGSDSHPRMVCFPFWFWKKLSKLMLLKFLRIL